MSPFDPKSSSTPKGIGGGVTVIVRDRPEPAPIAEPAERVPRVVVVPPAQATRDRDAFIRALEREHGEFIRTTLVRRKDVLPESGKDLHQRVLLIASAYYEDHGSPRDMRAFLHDLLRKEISNHKRKWKPPVVPGADAGAVASLAPDPEATAALAEQRAKVERDIKGLPEREAETIRCVDLWGLTLEETAAAVGRPITTVADERARGKEKLVALGRASGKK